jgi:hypothetical protein
MGRRARDYALRTHSVEAYVAALLPFLDEVARAAPAIRAKGRIRAMLAELRLPTEPADLRRATRGLDSLLDSNQNN